jgi:hypothetical protein
MTIMIKLCDDPFQPMKALENAKMPAQNAKQKQTRRRATSIARYKSLHPSTS